VEHFSAAAHQAAQPTSIFGLALQVPQAAQMRFASSLKNSMAAPQLVHATSKMSSGVQLLRSWPGQPLSIIIATHLLACSDGSCFASSWAQRTRNGSRRGMTMVNQDGVPPASCSLPAVGLRSGAT
jgi:hypothetical protein